MAEVYGVLERKKYVIDSDPNTGITYTGKCNIDTFLLKLKEGLDPYNEPIWIIEQIVENGNITEKKIPYDTTTYKILKQGSLIWNNRTLYNYA